MTFYRNPWARWVALGCLLMMITACKPNPQNDIPYFQAFIQENSHRIADDPYISSTVRPGDKMYDFFLSLQRGKPSRHYLKSLIKEGNTDAMVWYARLMIIHINERNYNRELLQRAFFEGNPYAALELSDIGESCFYLGKLTLHRQVAESLNLESSADSQLNVCAKENRQIAIKGFEQLAEQGDLRAQYFLLQQKQWDQSTKTREQYLNEVIRFAKAHYYQPLMDYIDTILTKKELRAQLHSASEELEAMAVSLLTIAAQHNYTPAINKLIDYNKKQININDGLFEQGIKLGSLNTFGWKSLIFRDDINTYTPQNRYFDAFLLKKLLGNDSSLKAFELDGFKVTDKEKQAIEDDVDAFIKTITPMVHIDGFTHRMNWVK